MGLPEIASGPKRGRQDSRTFRVAECCEEKISAHGESFYCRVLSPADSPHILWTMADLIDASTPDFPQRVETGRHLGKPGDNVETASTRKQNPLICILSKIQEDTAVLNRETSEIRIDCFLMKNMNPFI